ncbi:RidA family protein [Pararhodonellum marinum]|uniref:RidA family protein n=1 Tax=Pararhodonellum marinum TaxID=2755358 RepID=UPI00188E9C81|nr:RidA family protein [Pararhodonellum marinum]
MKSKKSILEISAFLAVGLLISCGPQNSNSENEQSPIVRYDRPEASILKGVHLPEGKEYYFTSGLVAPVKDPDAAEGTYEKFGDTYEQSVGTLERIKETLSEAGFELADVFFLRIYLAPNKEGHIDWEAWFKAYGEYFNLESNPNKVARSTIAVYALANPDLLIEIEAVAAK